MARFASRVLDPFLHSVGREISVLRPELSPIPEGGQIRLKSFGSSSAQFGREIGVLSPELSPILEGGQTRLKSFGSISAQCWEGDQCFTSGIIPNT